MIIAKLRHLRISPRKVRLTASLIKGMGIEEAGIQLKLLPKRAAKPILKLLNSAIANAEHNFNLSKENLYISKIIVDPGPSLKRWLPRAMGRATPILKRTSHITIVLDGKVGLSKLKSKKVESVERPSEPLKSVKPVVKKPKKTMPKFEKIEKMTMKKRGLKEVAQRIFRRKSI